MKSIKARFAREQKRQPFLSDIVNYIKAINCQNFTKRVIVKNLYELVDKQDYKHLQAAAKKQLICYLVAMSKPAQDSKKRNIKSP